MSDVAKAVTACAEAARDGARSLAAARDEAIDEALRGMAMRLGEAAGEVLAANAKSDGPNAWPLDRMESLLTTLVRLDSLVKERGFEEQAG